jgi:hypothetical protein
MSLVNPKGLQHFSDANGLAAARRGSRTVFRRKTGCEASMSPEQPCGGGSPCPRTGRDGQAGSVFYAVKNGEDRGRASDSLKPLARP